MQINYSPPVSLEPFLVSDMFVNLVVGPVGSTKTTAGIMKIAYEAQRVKACHDGIRRSRAVWVRNTREQLADTSIPDFLKFFPDGVAGAYMRTERKFFLRFGDVDCEILFRGLDDANDVRRLLSLQLSFGIMDEFREIRSDIFDALQGRLGRYPDKAMNGVGCCDDAGKQIDKVWGMSNPPDYDSYFEQYLSDPPSNAAVFIQPSGRSPEADWLQYLKDGYYDNLAEGKTADWISVYIDAKFGKSLSGQPVFRAFDRELHVAKGELKPNGAAAGGLIIGFDCGLTPASVIGQLGYDGKLYIYHALTSQGMGAMRFVREKLKPVLATRFPGMSSIVIIDPAGYQRAQTDERCVADILKAEGFMVRPAKTNAITARISAVDNFLTRLVDSKPVFQIDKDNCTDLVKAFAGKYRYKIRSNGDVDDSPAKDHPHSDIADACQYLCLHADGGNIYGGNHTGQRRTIMPAPYRWAA